MYLSRCVVISMYREYRAIIAVFAPIRINVMLDHEKVNITTNSSLIRLIFGGRARLVKLAKSHQVALVGRMFTGLRLELLFSYGFVCS